LPFMAEIVLFSFARFRFIRTRESNSNPRFQIGSIDLYGERHL
jgi:hypothetical protein